MFDLMRPPLKIAVMGLGNFGQLHARTLAALPEASLVAVGTRKHPKARALATELGVPMSFSTMDELISSRVAEAVVVATMTDTHVAFASKALEAGMHVFVEKPVSENAVEIGQFEKLCQRSGRVVMAGHIYMFHSLMAPLVERVRKERFRAAHFVHHRPVNHLDLFPAEHPIRMTMVHDLYVVGQMVQNEEPIWMDAVESIGPSGRADMTWATLRWKDGRVITFHAHWRVPPGGPWAGWDGMEVFGHSYYAQANANPAPSTWIDEKVTWPVALEISTVDGRPTGMLAEGLRSFIAACRGGRVPAGCRIQDAVQVQRWVEQLMQSARSKRDS